MKRLISILLIFIPLYATAQYKMSPAEYIDTYKGIAISEMNGSGIPASITLAQGIFESGYGGSRLATEGNNHFGIKCGGSWKGESLSHDDDAKDECFRKYKDAEESYRDHTIFLQNGTRYRFLFDLKPTDYVGWAHGLKSAGYATNPQYADQLISLIERYKLYEFDTNGNVHYASQNQPIITQQTKRTSGYINSVSYVVSEKGDTWSIIARDYSVKLSRLLKYNDLPCEIPLEEGSYVYIKAKKSKNKTVNLHTAQSGETKYTIAQRYGIKLKKLQRMNPQLKNREVWAGDLIRLR